MYKPIKEYESYGVIDEYGNIKRHNSNKVRKTCKDSMGYEGLTIRYKRELIKNLVYSTFVGCFNPSVEHVIYIDGNSNNHHYTNLQAVPKHRFKLSPDVAETIRKERTAGGKLNSLASKYGVSKAMISYIASGKRY